MCDKCGCGFMIDDSDHEIVVFRCWVCGNRIYLDHPKRSGALVCSRCCATMLKKNELGLCTKCLKVLKISTEWIGGRNCLKPSAPAAGSAISKLGATLYRGDYMKRSLMY